MTKSKTKSGAPKKPSTPQRAPSAKNYNAHTCFRCGKSIADHCGPDGKNTLCLSCFNVYKDCNLQLYQSANGKVSVLAKNSVLKVKDYEFPIEKPGERAYSLDYIWLNPVVLLVENFEEPPMPVNESSQAGRLALEPISYVRVTTHAGMTSNRKRSREEFERSPSVQKVLWSAEGREGGNDRPTSDKARGSFAGERADVNRRKILASTDHVKKRANEAVRTGSGCTSASDTGSADFGQLTGNTVNLGLNNRPVRLNGVSPSSSKANGVCAIHSVKASYVSVEGKRMVHRFKLEEKPCFRVLLHGLKYIFEVKEDVDVFYTDDGGDEVSLTSDNEMLELFDVVRKCRISPIRIKVAPRQR